MMERRGFLRLAMGVVGLGAALGVPGPILERARTWVVYGNGQDGDLILSANTVLADSRRYKAMDMGLSFESVKLARTVEIYWVRTLRVHK